MANYKSQENYADKMKAKGCVRIMLWVPAQYSKSFKSLARDKIKEIKAPLMNQSE